jgi:hypothetical protein
MFTAGLNSEQVQETQARLVNFAGGLEKAFQDRTNEALRYGRERTVAEIASHAAVNRSVFWRSIGIDPASQEGTVETITGALFIDDTRTIPLNAFKATQTSEGVEVEFMPGGVSKMIYPGAFGPKIAKLGYNIYTRVNPNRFPISKIADLTASKIPGIPEKLKSQRDAIKAKLLRDLEESKRELIAESGFTSS